MTDEVTNQAQLADDETHLLLHNRKQSEQTKSRWTIDLPNNLDQWLPATNAHWFTSNEHHIVCF